MKMTDSHDILGLVLPTNEPETAKSHILRSLNSFKEVAPIATFLLNFQEPWTKQEAVEVTKQIQSYGFNVIPVFNKYEVKGKGLVPINKIRNDTAMLLPNAKFYALIDDDMTFRDPTSNTEKSAGQQYVDVIHYMTHHPKCGLMLMSGQLVKNPPKYVLAPTKLPNSYLTNRGYILRAMPAELGQFLPLESIDLLGSDEDRLLASYRLYYGYYPAKMSNSRTSHYDGTVVPGYQMYDWNTKEILNANNHGFIREHYYPEFDGSEYDTRVVNWDRYIEAGGIDVYDEDIIKNNSVNYYQSNIDDEIAEIIQYFNQEV